MNAPEPPTESAARAPEPPSVLPSAATRRRWGRWWHWVLATFALPLLLALVLGGVAWVWTGTGTSLASAVRLAAERLPSDQSLVAEGVTGSVRAGGHIDLLRWQRAGLTVEARDVTIGWEWPLLPKMVQERSLRLQTLTVGSLRIDDQRPPSGTPFEPPTELVLPIAVDVPLNVGTVTFTGPPAVVATGLAGSYRFDGTRHDVNVTALKLADGRYRGTASLLARAPMTLDLQVQGDVIADVPGGRGPLPLSASATVRGPLAGASAQLAVDAQLRPVVAGAGAAQPMQATVTAVVAPWAAQPVVQARAMLSRVNVAALWPDAPQTLLSGDVLIAPVAGSAPSSAAAWSFEGRLTNGLAGPWDQRRLPVQRLVTSGVVEAGRVVVRRLDADARGRAVAGRGHVDGHRYRRQQRTGHQWMARHRLGAQRQPCGSPCVTGARGAGRPAQGARRPGRHRFRCAAQARGDAATTLAAAGPAPEVGRCAGAVARWCHRRRGAGGAHGANRRRHLAGRA
jgi:translocation and assembly module TamB